jgi:hypothetical protein
LRKASPDDRHWDGGAKARPSLDSPPFPTFSPRFSHFGALSAALGGSTFEMWKRVVGLEQFQQKREPVLLELRLNKGIGHFRVKRISPEVL